MVDVITVLLPLMRFFFIIVGAALVIWLIATKFKKLVSSSINDPDGTNALVSLVIIYIILFTSESLISNIAQISGVIAPYINTFQSAFMIFSTFFTYTTWIIVALIIVFALKNLKPAQYIKQ